MATARKVWNGNEGLRRMLAPVDEMQAHPRNPRRGNVEAIRASLERFGQQRPILALPDGTVVAGNHTLRAAVDAGWTHIAVVRSDLTEAEVEAYLLADNRTGDLGEYEDDLLAELLKPYYDADALRGTGYERDDVEELLADIEWRNRGNRVGDPDAVVDPPADPRSALGEVYELGGHRLMCGDATDDEQVRHLTGGGVDLVLTDPPYGVKYQGGAQEFSARTGKRKTRTVLGDQNAELYAAALPVMFELLRPDGSLYLWFSDSRSREVLNAVVDSGFTQRAVIIWVKDVPTGALTAQYIPRHEPLLYASKAKKAPRFFGATNEVTIWEHPKPRTNDLHPTQKPVALLERAILNSTRRGETVLDLFGGSGSTLVAAEVAGRRALIMEIDPAYCDVIRQRYADFTGQPEYAPTA